MIDFKSIIENLRETADNYERHLTEIDQFLSEKGLLDDYRDFINRKVDEKQLGDNKKTAESIAEQKKKEEESKAEGVRFEEEKAETEAKELKNDKDPEEPLMEKLFGGAVSFALISSSLEVIGEKLHMTLSDRDGNEAAVEYTSSNNSAFIEDGIGRSRVLAKIQKRKLLRLLAQVPKMAPEACIPQNVCDYLRPVELAIRHENIVRNYPDWDLSDIGMLDYEDYIRAHPDSSEMDYFDYITDGAVKAFAEPTGKEKGRYMSAYAELSDDFADVQIQDGFFELGELRQKEQNAEYEKKRSEKKKQL